MEAIMKYRVLFALLLIGVFTVSVVAGMPGMAYAGKKKKGGGCSPTTVDDYKYHTIIDHTMAGHLNVMVSNTETVTGKSYPLTGACPNPWAGVDESLFPAGYTQNTPPIYVEVNVAQADLMNASLVAATANTADQGNPALNPAVATVPTTFTHRLGTWDGNTPGTVTALPNTALSPGNVEPLNNMFTTNGQAFDLDRLRYVANRLWYEWYLEKKPSPSGTSGWATKFSYQPTGTMSFETFIDNLANGNPMYGIVRVVVPVNSSQDALFDGGYPVHGAEFATGAPAWSNAGPSGGPGGKANSMWSYEGSADAASSKRIIVYGMLLFDYVDEATYTPNNFFDDTQDYTDRYADIATHDAASHTGKKNFILPRTTGRNVYIKNWDALDINAANDLETFALYTDAHTPGPDGRSDTLDIVRRKYMMASSTAFQASEISDAYVWEYWMRTAAATDATSRATIISDLISQYNISTQKFNAGAARRTTFEGGTVWGDSAVMATKDKFHAYFPNAYERGWMIAFDALDMEALDGTNGAGWWWSHLADDTTGVGSVAVGGSTHAGRTGAYPVLGAPSETITVDADGDGAGDTVDGATSVMPNFFLKGWEDYPALAFAGGVLDMHGHANISGMLYTPDSAEIEAKSEKAAAFQYINGAMLFGNGVILEGKSGQHSMIAVTFNFATFDRLRGGDPKLTISPVQTIREIRGQ